jgi:hypothetical protein
MKRTATQVLTIAPVDRYAKAVEQAEAALAVARERRGRLADGMAAAVLRAVEQGQDVSATTHPLALADAEIEGLQRAVTAARDALEVERRKVVQADAARRWRDTEALATGPMRDAMVAMEAACDGLAAAYRDFAMHFEKLRAETPRTPQFWPAVWSSHLSGYVRQRIGSQCELLGVLASERPAILEGPSLVERHDAAVTEFLTTTNREAA